VKRCAATALTPLAIAGLGLVVGLLASGAPRVNAADPPPPRAAGPKIELRVGIPWTPENLDPTMNLSSIRATVGVSLFDSLVGRDRDNRIVPELAESWKLLNDTTWQFKLRRGVVFHNGEPFNAEAVRFTIERVLDPNQKSPNRANIGEIVRVEALDDLTVNIVTGKPYAPLLNRLIDFPILPPKYTTEKGNQGMALRPVGTGPYRFVSLVKDDQMVVEAFDRHWRGAPAIPRLVFKAIPEPFTRPRPLTIPPPLTRPAPLVAPAERRIPGPSRALRRSSRPKSVRRPRGALSGTSPGGLCGPPLVNPRRSAVPAREWATASRPASGSGESARKSSRCFESPLRGMRVRGTIRRSLRWREPLPEPGNLAIWPRPLHAVSLVSRVDEGSAPCARS